MPADMAAGREPRDKTTFGQLLDDVLEVALTGMDRRSRRSRS
jgi:hypothetical protein